MTTDRPRPRTTLRACSEQVITLTKTSLVTLTTLGLLVAGCTSTDAPPAPTSAGPPPTVSAEQAAMATYTEFWRVTDAARAAPTAKDWAPQIERLSSGQALQTALTDVRNYASLAAHTVGTITRAPSVVTASPARVTIIDCVDLGDSRLISDRDGGVLDDMTRRVQRFRLRAEVDNGPDGRWLVTSTAPALDEPC